MRIRVDNESCSGQARCAFIAPEIYELDDMGYNAMGDTIISEGMLAVACKGALSCPERAIFIVDEDGRELGDEELSKYAGIDN